MADHDNVPPDYLKGFNEGYLIAEHMSDLAEKLANVNGDSLRVTGLKEGIEQFNKDKTKQAYPKWLEKDRLSSLEKETPKEKDKEGPGKD